MYEIKTYFVRADSPTHLSWALSWWLWPSEFCWAVASFEQGLCNNAETLRGYGVMIVIDLASLTVLHPSLFHKMIRPFPTCLPSIPRLPIPIDDKADTNRRGILRLGLDFFKHP